MKDIIEKYNIECLWHFTDAANLPSIKKHGGLWSLNQLREQNINIPVPGGNEDSHRMDHSLLYNDKLLAEYVRLCFVNDSPMLYVAQNTEKRITNPRWLEINCAIIEKEGVLVSDGIAFSMYSGIYSVAEAESKINFEAIFVGSPETYGQRKKAKKSEILIPNHIPLNYITFPD